MTGFAEKHAFYNNECFVVDVVVGIFFCLLVFFLSERPTTGEKEREKVHLISLFSIDNAVWYTGKILRPRIGRPVVHW